MFGALGGAVENFVCCFPNMKSGGGSEEEEEAAGAPAQDQPLSGCALLAVICARPQSLSPASKARLQQDASEEDSSSPEKDANIPSAGSAPAVHIHFCDALDKNIRGTAPQRTALRVAALHLGSAADVEAAAVAAFSAGCCAAAAAATAAAAILVPQPQPAHTVEGMGGG